MLLPKKPQLHQGYEVVAYCTNYTYHTIYVQRNKYQKGQHTLRAVAKILLLLGGILLVIQFKRWFVFGIALQFYLRTLLTLLCQVKLCENQEIARLCCTYVSVIKMTQDNRFAYIC